MARASGFTNCFNAGEISPELSSRTDLVQHAQGFAAGTNFIGLVGGSLARAPGFWDAGAAIGQAVDAPSWLIPFRKSRNDALMLEFGHLVMRVWGGDYTPVMDGGDPLEVVSPFTQAQLSGLRFEQDNDVLFLFNEDPAVRPYSLARTSNTSWTFAPLDFQDGPWLPENVDRTKTVAVAGTVTAGGSVTLTALEPMFSAAMVGGLMRLRANVTAVSAAGWVAGFEVLDGYHFDETDPYYCQSNGRIYRWVETYSGTASHPYQFGTNPPVHEDGTVWDGTCWWEFAHDGAGVLEITAYTDANTVDCLVKRTLPIKDGEETACWSEGAYSAYRGWPTAVPAIHDQRLVMGANTIRPDILDASRTAGFRVSTIDMKPGLGTGQVVDDDAVRKSTGGGGRRIVWLSSSTALVAGTTVGEVLLTGPDGTDPLVPASRPGQTVSDFGSADAMPAKAHGSVLFIERSGETLCSFGVNPDATLGAEDQSVVAGHIGARGLVQIAWAGRPDNICWARLADGGLASFAWHKEMQVRGWTTRVIGDGGWIVEAIATLPAYGQRDAVWCVARRPKGEGWQRRILVISKRTERMRLDAARLYEGDAVNGVDGLDHFAGETVTLMAGDGTGGWAEYTDVEVNDDGEATLPPGVTAPVIIAGQPYLSRFESLPLDLGGPGSTQARRQRLISAKIVAVGVAMRAGSAIDGENAAPLDNVRLDRLTSETNFRRARKKVHAVTLTGGHDEDPHVVIECDSGFDLEIRALRPVSDVN